MNTKSEIRAEDSKTLERVFKDYQAKGLLSIYFWGSIITSDFNPETSDIDVVGVLADEADFEEINKMRDWQKARI